LFLVVSICFWLSVFVFGCQFLFLVVSICFWLSVFVYGYRYFFGCQYLFLVVSICFWLSVSVFGFKEASGNWRQVEKRILDGILGADVYDSRMRPSVSD
jgi:hypothetical protein